MYVEMCVSVGIYAYIQFISQWKKKKKKKTQTVVVKEMQSTNFLFILLDK